MLVHCLVSFALPAGISWGDRNCNKFYTSKLGLKSRCKSLADCHTFKHSFIRKPTTMHMWDMIFCYAKSESSCYWIAAFPTATQNTVLNTHTRELSLWKMHIFSSSQEVWFVLYSQFIGNLQPMFSLSPQINEGKIVALIFLSVWCYERGNKWQEERRGEENKPETLQR